MEAQVGLGVRSSLASLGLCASVARDFAIHAQQLVLDTLVGTGQRREVQLEAVAKDAADLESLGCGCHFNISLTSPKLDLAVYRANSSKSMVNRPWAAISIAVWVK